MLDVEKAHDCHPVCSQTNPETSNYEMFLFHPFARAEVETCKNKRGATNASCPW